jgi:hypothetical protein
VELVSSLEDEVAGHEEPRASSSGAESRFTIEEGKHEIVRRIKVSEIDVTTSCPEEMVLATTSAAEMDGVELLVKTGNESILYEPSNARAIEANSSL